MVAANEKAIYTESFIAGEALSDYQYHGVYLSANLTVLLEDAITDIPCGILLNEPGDGEQAIVMVIGRVPIVASETLTVGQKIHIDGDGHAAKWEVADTTVHCVGQVIYGATTNEKVICMVNFCSPELGT